MSNVKHPFCHLVHSARHFIQDKFGYLEDRNNLLTFALVIGLRWKGKIVERGKRSITL